MEKRMFCQDGPAVSVLGVGAWSFGGGTDSYWGAQDQRDVDALVSEALDVGVNFFDTAFGYNGGQSEISLGQALRGKRDKAVICDKLPIQEDVGGFEEAVVGGLRRLGTDYVDLLMIHWPTKDARLLEDNLRALERVRQKGYIRAAAVSNFGLGTLEIARQAGVRVAANEFAYNLMTRAIEYDILPYCQAQDIGIAAYMPIMQGILTGKYAALSDIPDNRRRSIHFAAQGNPKARHGGPGAEPEVLKLLDALRALAAQTGRSAGDLALAWCVARPGITTTIVGCRNVTQLRANAAAAETPLSPDVAAALDAASQPLKDALGNEPDLWMQGEQRRIW